MLKHYRPFFSILLAIFSTFTSTFKVHAEDNLNPPVAPVIEEAWVAYATANYFSLLEVTIASVHAFSTRPIVAVGVNDDIPFSTEKYPRLIKKRINVDLQARPAYVYKPQALLEANVTKGIYIDADAILNRGCDELFNHCALVNDHPLCPVHEDEAPVAYATMEFFGIAQRSMHYVHADLIVFSSKCLPFITHWHNTCMDHCYLGNPCWDETLLNVLLWKQGATDQLFRCDPYNAYIDRYLALDPSEDNQPPYNHWFVFHGNKDPQRGWNMLRSLQERANQSRL